MQVKKELFHRFKKNEKGSFTIEASIIFPILLILVLLFVFFSLVIYEKVALQYKANSVVSKLAYSWSSSTMDVHTGEMTESDYVTVNNDGLYWRLFDNNASQKFGFNLGDSNLVEKKTERIDDYTTDVFFRNGPLVQEIRIEIEKQLSLPSFVSDLFGIDKIGASASHPVLEPTEVIRNTDFMIYGFNKITEKSREYFEFFIKD